MRGQSVDGHTSFFVPAPVNEIIEILVGVIIPLRIASVSLKQASDLPLRHAGVIFLLIHLALADSSIQAYQNVEPAERVTTALSFVAYRLQRLTIAFLDLLRCFANARRCRCAENQSDEEERRLHVHNTFSIFAFAVNPSAFNDPEKTERASCVGIPNHTFDVVRQRSQEKSLAIQ